MKSYTPDPLPTRMSKASTAELHRALTDYRFVFTVFSKIGAVAKGKVQSIQSEMMRRGASIKGKSTPPNPNSLARPLTGGGGVSAHAMLRYLERVKGIDLEALGAEIAERLENGESYYGGAVITDKEGISYIMSADGLVKTIMADDWLAETDKVAAEEVMRRQARVTKDDAFRALAKEKAAVK